MPRIPFDQLPDDARLWVFPTSRPLTPSEEEEMVARVDAFLDQWVAHGAPLSAGRDWREGRFLLVAVDEASAPPTGCSIDSLARMLRDLGREWDVSFLDHSPVWYRKDGEAVPVSRRDFKSMAEAGEVSLETPVFDNAVTRVSQLRGSEWEKPAGASWHRRAFFQKKG